MLNKQRGRQWFLEQSILAAIQRLFLVYPREHFPGDFQTKNILIGRADLDGEALKITDQMIWEKKYTTYNIVFDVQVSWREIFSSVAVSPCLNVPIKGEYFDVWHRLLESWSLTCHALYVEVDEIKKEHFCQLIYNN